MDSSQVKAAFIRLKPLCDAFLSTPTKANLSNLMKECKGLKPCILQEVYAYVLFPFTVHLRKHHLIKPPDLRMVMVQVVNDIFSRTHVDSVEMYFKYFYLMIIQIFVKDSLETATIDEDFTLCVVKTITTLTLRIPHDIRFKLYTRSNATKLGQGIYVCVQLARKFQYKALRLASIHCILAICTLHDDLMGELHTPMFNVQLAECVGDVLMFFLPGLLGAMQDIAKGDQKQAHAITCLAIKTISRVLCLTMMDQTDKKSGDITNDDFLKLVESCRITESEVEEKPDPFGIKLRAKGVEGMKKHLEKAERNRDWYDAAGEKLTLLMKSLLSVQYHPHERVRKEAALMCSSIVKYCPRNMYPSMKYILEMLIASLEDTCPDISSISREALQNFTINSVQNNRKRLLDILEENFSTVLTKLPRYLNKLDGDLQLCGIRLFKGYVRLMTDPGSSPQRLTQILSCTYVMNRFAIILVEIFKLECGNVQLLEKCTLKTVDTPKSKNYMWNINYANLQNDDCVRSALDICKILGASESLEIIIDYFLEQFRLDNECKKEIIFILNELLISPNIDNIRTENLIKGVINAYIDHDNWYLPISVGKKDKIVTASDTLDVTIYNPHEPIKTRTLDLYEGATEVRYTDVSYKRSESNASDINEGTDDQQCQTIAEAQSNIVQICLMTEGIGKIAKFMGKNFQPYLLKTLYLILERAANNLEMIRVAGITALNDIAEAFQLKNITELIKTNADYFTHHINMKLKKLSVNPEVLDVLLIVMRYSEVDVLMCLYSIVSSVLDQSHKSYSMGNSIVFLKLFYAFVIHVGSKFPNEDVPKTASEASDKKYQSNNVLYIINEYKKNLNIINSVNMNNKSTQVNGIGDDYEGVDEGGTDDYNDQLTTEEKKTVPPHISMVVSVLKRTLNYLPSNDRMQKLLAIGIIKEGIHFIRDWEDEVLPLIHQTWSPLVHRFKETSQPIVINRSLRLLVTFAHISKDFIRKRTTEEVIPVLCDFLVKTTKDSTMKDVGNSYRFTQAYKLQLAILEYIGELSVLLNLQEKVIYNIMNAVHPYLSAKQPKPLQAACIETFKALGDHNLGLVWIHLNTLCIDDQINTTFQKLRSHNVKEFQCLISDQSEIIDYKLNVCALLDYLKNKNDV